MHILVAQDNQKLLDMLIEIRNSLAPSSAMALYHTYRTNSERCDKFVNNRETRKQMGLEGYTICSLTALAAEHLLNIRPMEQKLEVYHILKAEVKCLFNGTLNFNLGAHQGRRRPNMAEMTNLAYKRAEQLYAFPIKFF